MSQLNAPHGGKLVDLLVSSSRAEELQKEARDLPSWDLTPRQLCDLEMLMSGGFSPLSGFMKKADYNSVCQNMALADGTLWPIPITLDVTEAFTQKLNKGKVVALRDPEGVMLAALHVEDLWAPDREAEAKSVFGSTHPEHPGAAYLLERTGPWYIGGRVEGVQAPPHYDYQPLRRTPRELRARFEELGWSRVVGFQTRNPMHRAHYELTLQACREQNANLLIHPVVGLTKPGDLDHYTRVRCYRHILNEYPEGKAELSLLPLAMRMGGPREAVLHAIIRKNHGCSHFIVGRDHAGPGSDSQGKPFYGPYEAQELLKKHEEALGVEMVPFQRMTYLEEKKTFVPASEVPEGAKTLDLSGTDLRSRLASGSEIPDWFTFPEVATELRKKNPARNKQGFCVFFTGLSGAGKSTVANVLMVRFLESQDERSVTLLDGDIVRTNLSSELGFSKEHRDLNIRRIGFVASEITKNGGIAICAPIAPYDAVRKDVRAMITDNGCGFLLVHVSTPLEECERRDRKGLYAKARAGIVKEFTGISDPYEVPADARLTLDTTHLSPEAATDRVLLWLREAGYIQ